MTVTGFLSEGGARHRRSEGLRTGTCMKAPPPGLSGAQSQGGCLPYTGGGGHRDDGLDVPSSPFCPHTHPCLRAPYGSQGSWRRQGQEGAQNSSGPAKPGGPQWAAADDPSGAPSAGKPSILYPELPYRAFFTIRASYGTFSCARSTSWSLQRDAPRREKPTAPRLQPLFCAVSAGKSSWSLARFHPTPRMDSQSPCLREHWGLIALQPFTKKYVTASSVLLSLVR